MKTLDIKILEDIDILKQLMIWQIILFIIPYFVFSLLKMYFLNFNTLTFTFNWIGNILIAVLITGGVVLLHELIHGLFFKIFRPDRKVTFGYMQGAVYAASFETIFKINQFYLIALMPFIVNTVLLVIWMYLWPSGVLVFVLAFHTSACVGDFYYVYLFRKYKDMKFVEDTNSGIILYSEYPK